MKFLIALALCVGLNQTLFADTPVSINAVLVPSDSACNSCRTGEPLYVNSFGVGIFPSDESCRKCDQQASKKSADTFDYNEAKKKCDESLNEAFTSLESIADAISKCDESANKLTNDYMKASLNYGALLMDSTLSKCSITVSVQIGKTRAQYDRAIGIIKDAKNSISVLKNDLKENKYCSAQ